jgi:membrane protease YdiL (CAAX protease family)
MIGIDETPPLPEAAAPRRLGHLAAAAATYIALLAGGSVVGGELGQIAQAGLNALPFAALAVLAYLGEGRFNWAQLATGLWLALLAGGTGLLVVGVSLLALSGGAPESLGSGGLLRLGLVVLGVLIAFVGGALCLLPPLRRAAARVLPLDPGSFVHAAALSCVVSVILICTVPLLVIGQPPFLLAIDQITESGAGAVLRDSAGQLRDQLYGLIWTIPAAILAVGYGISRDLRQSLARLGLVRPTPRQILAAIGIALALAAAVQLLGLGIDWLWKALGWPTTDEEAFGDLISFAFSPLGAAVIGLTAGLGEELSVRGVLQPRLGILLSNLFFVSLHALQYNWDALLVVFLVGLVCGAVRRRSNTSTAAIVHGTYNFSLIVLALFFG